MDIYSQPKSISYYRVMSNAERQARFRKRNPNYHRRYYVAAGERHRRHELVKVFSPATPRPELTTPESPTPEERAAAAFDPAI